MKKAIIQGVLFLSFVAATTHAGINDGLVAYYPFNGNADDQSGNGNHGGVYGAMMTADRNGNPDSAYSFDGVDDYIYVNSSQLSIAYNLTVSVWIKNTDQNFTDGYSNYIISKGNSPYPYNDYAITLLPSMKVMFRVTNVSGIEYQVSSNILNNNTFYHVVAIYDYTDSKIRLFINGNLKEEMPISGEIRNFNNNFYIGDWNGKSGWHFWKGGIDDVRIYNRVLSETEIQKLYYGFNDGLVAYYPFNGNANDESGNGNHGTVHGASLTEDLNGNPNSAYSFDGINDYIEVPDNDSLDLTTAFTLAAWVYLDSYDTGDPDYPNPNVISKKPDNYEPYRLILNAGSTHLQISSSSSYREFPMAYTPVPLHQWVYVAVTFDSGNLNFYHDGVLIGSPTSTITELRTTGGNLIIGSRTSDLAMFGGKIDEVRIYNRALSATEILELSEQQTIIELSSFTAVPANKRIAVEWTTESEIDTTGFNIYRSEDGGEYEQINSSLIPAEGSPAEGAAYEFVDDDVKNRKNYWYRLEDIDYNGISTMHGPVSATPRLIYGIGQ